MKRYEVESVVCLGGDSFETKFSSPGERAIVIRQQRPGATLAEMRLRADKKCRSLNAYYGADKFDVNHSPYRTVNQAFLENGKLRRRK